MVFLKTHKTASSTLQNILFRFGDKYGLNFALPLQKINANYPKPIKREFFKPLKNGGGEFDIMCHHAVANRNMRQLVPGAKLITIVRSIPSLYESTFDYFGTIVDAYKRASNLETFYAAPNSFYRKSSDKTHHFAHNHLTFDLGYENDNDYRGYGDRIADEILATSDLVLISDYFFESMILLKHELCWEWADVVYLVTNQREDPVQLSPELSSQIKKWNSLDAQIFDAANATFWRKYNQLSNVEEMRDEFTELLESVKDYCIASDSAKCSHGQRNCSFVPAGVKMKGFELTRKGKHERLCTDLVRPELAYTDRLFAKQWPILNT